MIFYMGIQKFLFTFFNIYILSLSRLNRSVVAYVAGAWRQWAQEKTGAREGDTPSRAPVLSFAHYFQAPATQAMAL